MLRGPMDAAAFWNDGKRISAEALGRSTVTTVPGLDRVSDPWVRTLLAWEIAYLVLQRTNAGRLRHFDPRRAALVDQHADQFEAFVADVIRTVPQAWLDPDV
jgi:hypothetical protein